MVHRLTRAVVLPHFSTRTMGQCVKVEGRKQIAKINIWLIHLVGEARGWKGSRKNCNNNNIKHLRYTNRVVWFWKWTHWVARIRNVQNDRSVVLLLLMVSAAQFDSTVALPLWPQKLIAVIDLTSVPINKCGKFDCSCYYSENNNKSSLFIDARLPSPPSPLCHISPSSHRSRAKVEGATASRAFRFWWGLLM